MRRTGQGLHTLVGAYVMDAVPAADRAAFERHLNGCAPCRDEVRELRETAAHLAVASSIEPRPELRAATLAAAAWLRQLPPLVSDLQPAGLSGRMRRSDRRPEAADAAWTRWLARPRWLAGASPLARTPRQARTAWPASRIASVPWLARIVAVTALIAVTAAVALGVRLSSMQHQLSAAQQREHAIAAVLGAPDAVTLTAKVTTGGTATVVMSPRAKMLVFTGNGLSALPATKAYELWLMGPAGDRSVGMLRSARHGMFGPMVVGGLHRRDQVGLTIEPVAGSGQPTTRPIVMVGLGG
jgi:hypothetical protein